jgi:hypothetical protein
LHQEYIFNLENFHNIPFDRHQVDKDEAYLDSSIITIPAMLALVKVLNAPDIRAEIATRETSLVRPGASCARTPI